VPQSLHNSCGLTAGHLLSLHFQKYPKATTQ
jgi:hypothetical protein